MPGQTDFTAALFDAARPVPEGLVDPDGRPAGRRFDVYRNNVAVSLTEALETGFPVLRKLLGEANFKGLAGLFLRAHPPGSPRLMHYGAEMPGFLEGLPQLAHLPYLPDVARLELALRESYHAADAVPVDPSALAALPPERLGDVRLGLAPAVRVLSSRWPVHGIWRRNTDAGAPKPEMRPEDVLVARPEYDPVPVLLPPGGAAFLRALGAGHTVARALDVTADYPDFDLTATLSALLSGAAITRLEVSP